MTMNRLLGPPAGGVDTRVLQQEHRVRARPGRDGLVHPALLVPGHLVLHQSGPPHIQHPPARRQCVGHDATLPSAWNPVGRDQLHPAGDPQPRWPSTDRSRGGAGVTSRAAATGIRAAWAGCHRPAAERRAVRGHRFGARQLRGPSVDQRIAEVLGNTTLRSLELGVQVGAADNWGRMIYRAANQPRRQDDPAQVYANVFADLRRSAALARCARAGVRSGHGRRAVRAAPRGLPRSGRRVAGPPPDRGARDRAAPDHPVRGRHGGLPRSRAGAGRGDQQQRRLPGHRRAADRSAGDGACL